MEELLNLQELGANYKILIYLGGFVFLLPWIYLFMASALTYIKHCKKYGVPGLPGYNSRHRTITIQTLDENGNVKSESKTTIFTPAEDADKENDTTIIIDEYGDNANNPKRMTPMEKEEQQKELELIEAYSKFNWWALILAVLFLLGLFYVFCNFHYMATIYYIGMYLVVYFTLIFINIPKWQMGHAWGPRWRH